MTIHNENAEVVGHVDQQQPATATPPAIDLPDDVQRMPPGRDALDDLLVQELDIACRQLKGDVYEAVAGSDGQGGRWRAFALLGWLWHKRTDPKAKLQPYLELTGPQLMHVLRMRDDEDQPDDELGAEANPTDSAPVS